MGISDIVHKIRVLGFRDFMATEAPMCVLAFCRARCLPAAVQLCCTRAAACIPIGGGGTRRTHLRSRRGASFLQVHLHDDLGGGPMLPVLHHFHEVSCTPRASRPAFRARRTRLRANHLYRTPPASNLTHPASTSASTTAAMLVLLLVRLHRTPPARNLIHPVALARRRERYRGPKWTFLRLIVDDGLPVARGAAMALNFNCAMILLPVCRNIIDKARGVFEVRRAFQRPATLCARAAAPLCGHRERAAT